MKPMQDTNRTGTRDVHLVTGGAGFIGSHLVDRLRSEGHYVRILDNLSTGTINNVPADAELFQGDIRDLLVCKRAMKNVTHVYHLAALGSVPRSIEHPLPTHETNATGTLNLLECARHEKVKRFVFSSSSSVYGIAKEFPRSERVVPESPTSPYALSKLAAEGYCNLYRELHNVPTVILRYFNVFGPRQRADHPYAAVIPRFISALLKGEPLKVYGTSSITRDFTYVRAVVEANVRAATYDCIGQTINVANGEEHSLYDVIQAACLAIGVDILDLQVDALPFRKGDVLRSCADISKLKQYLGGVPEYDFPHYDFFHSIEATVAWLRLNRV